MKEIKDIAQNIKTKIDNGELKMKPKYYFVIGHVLAILGVIVFAIISTFSANLILHFLRVGRFASRMMELPIEFRVKAFFIVFPWEYLLISVGFIILGIWLLRKFGDNYKNSISMLFTLFAVIVFITAVFIDFSGFNERAQKLHLMRRIYDQRRDIPNFEYPMRRGIPEVNGAQMQRFQRKIESPTFERNF